jgi:hypothetical protein
MTLRALAASCFGGRGTTPVLHVSGLQPHQSVLVVPGAAGPGLPVPPGAHLQVRANEPGWVFTFRFDHPDGTAEMSRCLLDVADSMVNQWPAAAVPEAKAPAARAAAPPDLPGTVAAGDAPEG